MRRRGRRPVLQAAGVAVLACSIVVAATGAAEATVRRDAEDAFIRRVNRERSAAGLRPLSVDLQLTKVARQWTDTMVRRGRRSHNPNLRSDLQGSWGRLGENVGTTRRPGASQSELVRRLHRAFMDSRGHRANILGRFNRIGVGVRITDDRTMWVTVVFGQGSSAGVPLFRDAAGSSHERAIVALWRDGVVTGCSRDRYCPDRALTRAQAATMLVRAVDDLRPRGGRPFRDVRRRDPHAQNIAALARGGVASGCGSGRFCPDRPVTRAQMATFLVRAVDGLGRADPRFRDVSPNSRHARNIGGVAAAGVAGGCGGGRFCPDRPVTRAQAATMIHRATRR